MVEIAKIDCEPKTYYVDISFFKIISRSWVFGVGYKSDYGEDIQIRAIPVKDFTMPAYAQLENGDLKYGKMKMFLDFGEDIETYAKVHSLLKENADFDMTIFTTSENKVISQKYSKCALNRMEYGKPLARSVYEEKNDKCLLYLNLEMTPKDVSEWMIEEKEIGEKE